MGIKHEEAGVAYQKHLAAQGMAGTSTGNALMIGFMDGVAQGTKMHANVTAQALRVLEDAFREPVSIKNAREQVQSLREAIEKGSGL